MLTLRVFTRNVTEGQTDARRDSSVTISPSQLCWRGDNCIKFGQNPLKDVDSRVFTRMLRGKNLTVTFDLENQ
jgi:hypothetical protein